MRRVLVAVEGLVKKDDGQDLLEYGLLVVLIAIGAVVAVQALGNAVSDVLWNFIASTPI